MVEKGQSPEIERELLNSIYNNFIELANLHGQSPAEAMGMPSDGKVIKVEIPSESKAHKHTDFVSGRYYGQNTGQIGIMFRHLDRQVRFELALSNGPGSDAKIAYFNVYKAVGLDDKNPENFMLNPAPGAVSVDDLSNLKKLLTKAEEILENPQEAVAVSKKSGAQDTELKHARRHMARELGLFVARKRDEEREKKRKKK